MAKAAIGITAYNRPDCLRACLWSIDQQMAGPWNDWPIYLHLDGGGCKPVLVHNIVARSKRLATRTTIRVEAENIGINRNTYGTMQWMWDEGHDWAVYLEDDLVLSPDALRLAAWYIDHAAEIEATWSVDHIGAYCLCTRSGETEPTEILLTRALTGWGFVMSRAQWDWVEPAWLAGEDKDPPHMWDRLIANRIRERSPFTYNCQPVLSRILNIGRYGEHYTPETWERDAAQIVANFRAVEYEYELAGWTEAERETRRQHGLGDFPERPEHPPSLEK